MGETTLTFIELWNECSRTRVAIEFAYWIVWKRSRPTVYTYFSSHQEYLLVQIGVKSTAHNLQLSEQVCTSSQTLSDRSDYSEVYVGGSTVQIIQEAPQSVGIPQHGRMSVLF